jgi:hypothetical protein
LTLKPPDDANDPTTTPRRYVQAVYVLEDDVSPLTALDDDLTTPESAKLLVSRYGEADRLVSPDPGVYASTSGASSATK